MKKVLPKRKPERTRNTVFFANSFSCDLDFLYWQIICHYQTPCIPAEKKSVYSLSILIRTRSVFLSIFSSFCKNLRQIRKRRKALQIASFLAFDSFDRSFSAQSKVPPGSVESIPTSVIFQIEHQTRNLAFLHTFEGSNPRENFGRF